MLVSSNEYITKALWFNTNAMTVNTNRPKTINDNQRITGMERKCLPVYIVVFSRRFDVYSWE